jgi:hypothetical protein
MTEPHINIQLERLSRITKYLPRNDLESFLLTLAENFLQRESFYSQLIETLKNNVSQNSKINQ